MTQRPFKIGRWAIIAVAVLAGGAITWFVAARNKPATASEPALGEEPRTARAVTVEVVSPRPGGADRICTQPGSIEPFESANLYAKASGYLISQEVERDGKKLLKDGKPVRVDIGTAVQAGDILARISVPEYEKQVTQDTADVERAQARVLQMKAAITTAEADLGAATAGVALAEAQQKSKESYRAFREKQRNRIRDLADRNAIDRKLEDEQEDQYQAAVSAELAAIESVHSAKQREVAAASRVKQARADLTYAEAEVKVAQAKLEKSQVMLDYTIIRSPYTGVVTRRNFHHGDFIKSAVSGGDLIPLLTVERTDVMRVVVQIPERDVSYVNAGDPAIVKLDALPGISFKTEGEDRVVVSRIADSEDPHTRMMRVEVDLKNTDRILRRGMYGRVLLTLQSGSPTAVRVPSAALVGKAEDGEASVRVVRDDVAQIVPVHYGADDGATVEILSGLSKDDRVITRASGPIENGTIVTISAAK